MGIVVGARKPIRIFPHPVVTETASHLKACSPVFDQCFPNVSSNKAFLA